MASLSACAAVASLGAAIGVGPNGVYLASSIGIGLALLSLVLSLRVSTYKKSYVFAALLIAAHVALLFLGLFLQIVFLEPLSPGAVKMPKLQTYYVDPDGAFSLRGPAQWSYRPSPSRLESGVRMQPSKKTYMGVAEASVFVRRLETVPASPGDFLETAAAAFSSKSSSNADYGLVTERGTSLSGVPILWSEVTVKRFWAPYYRQVSLFGVKDGRYLVSVSALGQASHSALSRVLCMGLFERIVVIDRNTSAPPN